MGRHARAGAMPMGLAAALVLFGLVRLQPANTLWYQELTLSSDIETGEFGCEPLALEFVGLTHPEAGQTTLTYALSGGGTQGFGCPEKDISYLAIPVGTCLNPTVKADGPVIDESHPGTGDTAWKYDGKNSGSPKLVKWDSKTEDAPLGGKGPFDPAEMEFSITLDRVLNTGDLTEVMAYYKAGGETPDLGLVNVPKCPLPAPIAPLSLEEPGPASLGVVEDVPEEVAPEEEEPEEDVAEEFEEVEQTAPEKPGPAMINEQPQPPKKKPTPAPQPIGVAIHGGP